MDAQRLHVLVVDDLIDTVDTLVELLALWEYDVVGCYSGASALVSARANRPAVVLLDLRMPGMDGFCFAETLRTLPGCETIPLIACTGYSTRASRDRARAMGIEHYLVKPTEPAILEQLLARITHNTALSPLPIPTMEPIPEACLVRSWLSPGCRETRRESNAEAVLS